MKNVLSLLCAAGLLAGLSQSAHGSVSLLDGLRFYLDFEGAAPVDVSGNNVAVTNTGVSSNTLSGHYGAITGVTGNAGFFNRSQSDWLQIGIGYGKLAAEVNPQALGYSFTISAWYYMQPLATPPGTGNGNDRLFLYEGDVDYDLSFGIRGDSPTTTGAYIGTVYYPGKAAYDVSNAAYYDPITHEGAWQQVVETFSSDGTTVTKKIFLNGELVGTTSTSSQSSLYSPAINLGTYRDSSGRYWDGFMDEVGLWNRALTDVEISDLYDLNYIDGLSVTSLAPEPSRALLLMFGLVGLHFRRSRRKA